MAGEKNFNIKNGLSVGGVEVINSSGDLVAGGVGTAVQEAIADKIGGILQGSGSTTVTYDDSADTITISSTGKTEEEIQDIIGAAIVTNGTHSGITVAYDDAGDGAIDITVGTLNQNTTGSAATLTTPRAIQGVNFDGSADITTLTAGTGVGVSGTEVSIGQAVATSDKPSFAGITLTADSDITGHIIPTVDVTYDLGSSSKQWRDIYVGPGSLYVNGQQVVSDNSGTITVSADDDQNVSVQTGGSGDIELDATGTGNIQIKAPMQIQASNAISSSDGNAIQFSNSIDVDAIESRSTDTNLVLTGNGTGNVTINDSLSVTGDLTVSGTTTTVNSETISLADNIIALNSNFTSGSPTEDTGISVTRGGSASKTLLWDETNDKWTVGSETFVAATFEGALTGNVTGNITGSSGSTTGNAATATALETSRTIGLSGDVSGSGSFDGTGNLTITATIADDSHNHTIANVDGLQTALNDRYEAGDNLSVGTIASGAITITNATNAGGTARNMYQSTSAPASGDGAVGDMWILYS